MFLWPKGTWLWDFEIISCLFSGSLPKEHHFIFSYSRFFRKIYSNWNFECWWRELFSSNILIYIICIRSINALTTWSWLERIIELGLSYVLLVKDYENILNLKFEILYFVSRRLSLIMVDYRICVDNWQVLVT